MSLFPATNYEKPYEQLLHYSGRIHKENVKRLCYLGTSSHELKSFESYLTVRMQLTRVGTSLSDQLTVNYGVPQGSILRPAMLSLHMYDLPNAVQFSSVESYVDDTKIFLSFSSKDVELSLERNSEDLRHAAK